MSEQERSKAKLPKWFKFLVERKEAAQLLSTSVSQLDKLVAAGKIRKVYDGSVPKFYTNELWSYAKSLGGELSQDLDI